MKLTIVPLSTPKSLTVAAREAVLGAKRLYLQTQEHPSAAWVRQAGLAYESMDDLYAASEDFDALNAAIALRLFSAGEDAAFAVPGRGPGKALMLALSAKAKETGCKLAILPGPGYGDAAMAAAGADFIHEEVRILPANALPLPLDPSTPLCVEEVDTPIRAGEVKLALGEYYPDEFPVLFCTMEEDGGYHCESIPLFELDRQKRYFAATTLLLEGTGFEGLTRHGINGLTAVMARLRAPGGCPWDAEQTHESLKSSLLEESYEVLDAIDRKDMDALCEELGDLLLQVVFHAQIEQEVSSFTLRDVATGIVNKLIYRHPHVFGQTRVNSSAEVLVNWEELKKKEKQLLTATEAMQAVPRAFPALLRAYKIQKKAAHVGFDWPDATGALDKLNEETEELRQAIANEEGARRIEEELGDLLFSAVNAARLLKLDPELALTGATDKFFHRFRLLEEDVNRDGLQMEALTLAQLDERWNRLKKA